MNLATSAAILFIDCERHALSSNRLGRPYPGFLYYPLLATVRLYDVFQPAWWKTPPPGESLTVLFNWQWSQGMALAVLLGVLAVTCIAWLVMEYTRSGNGMWFRRFAVAAALLAMPTAVIISEIYIPTRPDFGPAQDPRVWLLPFFAVNLLALLLTAVAARQRHLKTNTLLLLTCAYCLVWIFPLRHGILGLDPHWWGFFKCVLLLSSCLVAVLALRAPVHALPRPGKWPVIATALVVAAALLVWMPARGEKLEGKRTKETRIELRQSCVGTSRCAAYRLLITGDGRLEFDGRYYVGAPGHHTKQLSPQQVDEILAALDAADFTALEPRAFLWMFHGRVLSVDVTTRSGHWRVSNVFVPTTEGPQQRFTAATEAIPKIAGVEHWIRCDEECHKRPVDIRPLLP